MTSRFRTRLLNTSLFVGAAMAATPALAQVTPATQETQQTSTDPNTPPPATEGQDIVVTGTLISNPNLVSSSPVSVVSENELTLRNINNVEQVIRELPGAVPGIGAAVNNGNGGFASINLRNLGEQRNLVLIDGDRIVPAASGGTVDLNNIPVALLQRVDVLTGGASTSYGADAVAGVANFITKKNFAGFEASASQQISERGDANYLRADVTIGANFDDGRGNAVLSIGYQEADPLYQGKRDESVFTIGSTNGVASGASPTSVPTGVDFGNGQGQLQLNPGNTALVAAYAPFNFSPYNIFQTPFKRYNMFAQANYEISDNLEVYTRGLFSKNTVQTIIAPSGIFAESLTIPGFNPYLSTTLRDQICTLNNIAIGAACNTNAAIPLPAVYRRTVEVGPRVSEYTTQVFDYKAGLRLRFSDHVKLDVSGSYGENDLNQTQSGYVLRSRVQQALNANNTTTCLVTTNNCVPLNLFGQAGSISSAQAGFLNGQSTIQIKTALSQAKAVLNGDFGTTIPSASEPIAFAAGAEYRKYTYRRIPDAFALSPGELGGAGGAILPFAGSYDVKEAFGEIIAPLVADKPFFYSLTLEGGVRYSQYQVQAANNPSFNATTFKGGATWEPFKELKFRGNYQRAVRAPNIAELFTPSVTALDNLSTDPCAGTAPVGNANLTLACRNQGAPASSIGLILTPASGQVNVTGGGNPNIRPETANTYTLGVLIQPRGLVPGLSVGLDYFNIKVENAITSATPNDILANCFGATPGSITAAQAASAACTSIRRSTTNGRLSGSTATVAGLPQPLTNNGRLATDGIDLTANYAHDFGDFGLDVGFQGTWTAHRYFRASETAYNRDCIGYYSVNCASIQPEYQWNQRTSLSFGPGTLSLLWRHIGAVQYEGQATDFAARGFTAANRNLFNGTVTGPSPVAGKAYNFNRIGAYNYFDLSAQFEVNENLTLTFSGRNIGDKKPPIVGSSAGATAFNSGNTYPSTYDVVGRNYSVSGKLRF
ncbi:TonB-dependent receptor [Sphingomonadaceae bacterium OTU29MARTA1]|uniref:TonB-dependent receptor domain-containing protein n=1 Tax=Sphingomonas sp. Leaf37 TaxID=2876552 RepID=UPI001E47087A|nr:TonB-dependent receptor [Sphingomonas sp. Leaf37]USU06004.1 TonB-dependent receptor [Sphingomonadaceae bacterium OTU29LAMAA1]USU09488.1 TonB-dependent receptor [Sphingomonadaceae bacterium OTU29MARTA1]